MFKIVKRRKDNDEHIPYIYISTVFVLIKFVEKVEKSNYNKKKKENI